MEFLSNLFKKKEKQKKDSMLDKLYNEYESVNQVSSFIDNLKTMEDCKLANTMIDDLGLSFKETFGLRDKLSNKTFYIFKSEIIS